MKSFLNAAREFLTKQQTRLMIGTLLTTWGLYFNDQVDLLGAILATIGVLLPSSLAKPKQKPNE